MWGSALVATLLVQIVSSYASAALPLLGPVLMQRWGLPPESIGYVSAMVSVGICWCLAAGGPMLDHHGPVRTLQIGLAAIALGMVALAQPLATLGFLGALLVGLGLAPNNPAGSQLLMRTAPPAHRNLIFSIRQAGVPLGGAIAGISVAPVVGIWGLPQTLGLIAVLLLISLVAVQPFQRELDAERSGMTPTWPRSFLSPSVALRAAQVIRAHPALPLITGIGISFSISQSSVQAFTATYLVAERAKSLTEAGAFVAVLLASSTLARILLGWLADRWRGGALLLSLLLVASGVALILLVWSAALPTSALYLCVALVGATSLGWNGVYMAELARLSPPNLIGEVTAAANLFGFIGSLSGPLVFALIASRTRSFDWPYLMVAAQLVACGLFCLWRNARR
jgi:MFS family permease